MVCAFCDFSDHHVSVFRKKKLYKEEQAKRRTIMKMEGRDEDDEYDRPSKNEEGDSCAEDDAVNVMEEFFWEPAGDGGVLVDTCRESH